MRTFDRDSAFLGDLFAGIATRSRRLLWGAQSASAAAATIPDTSESISELARKLISNRGEASSVALANQLLRAWHNLDTEGRLTWFELLASDFGPDNKRLGKAVETWRDKPSALAASHLASASEPQRQELFRRINLAPGGTSTLVGMRAELLGHLKTRPHLRVVDLDLVHLFSSWFNRGFLMMTRIDWSSPASILEKIIRYEAVHEIQDWDELKRRVQPHDRRCFAFIHPQMPQEPLIFVEVALTSGIPGEIHGLLRRDRPLLDQARADTAVFYSISNTQAGLKGISFGNFLIKQVVEDLLRDLPNLNTFVTLSPIPGFASWLRRERANATSDESTPFQVLDKPNWHQDAGARTALGTLLTKAAAVYLAEAKDDAARPLDPVARFHLGNGARLERVNANADLSPNGLKQSHGAMVNYLYDLPSIELNHESFANKGEVVCSKAVRKLLERDKTKDTLQSLIETEPANQGERTKQ